MSSDDLDSTEHRGTSKLPGVTVVITLSVLTVLEYVVSIMDVPASFAVLTLIAMAKAAAIVVYFMHFMNVFEKESR